MQRECEKKIANLVYLKIDLGSKENAGTYKEYEPSLLCEILDLTAECIFQRGYTTQNATRVIYTYLNCF
jgi:hypothetical protein